MGPSHFPTEWPRRRQRVRSAAVSRTLLAAVAVVVLAGKLPLPPLLLPTARAEDESTGDEGEGSHSSSSTVLGFLRPGSDSSGAVVALIMYALLLTVVGWVTALYPLIFVPKFERTLRDLRDRGDACRGRIVRYRLGRTFNPFRFLVPTRFNCYVAVEFERPDGNGSEATVIVTKELCVDVETFEQIRRSQQQQRDSGTEEGERIAVYTLPQHPHSGLLDPECMAASLTSRERMLRLVASAVLVSIGLWASLVVPSDVLFDSRGAWKFWTALLLGHGSAAAAAYWGCNFVYRNRVEAILYETEGDQLGAAAGGHKSTQEDERRRLAGDGQETTGAAARKTGGDSQSSDDAPAYRAMS